MNRAIVDQRDNNIPSPHSRLALLLAPVALNPVFSALVLIGLVWQDFNNDGEVNFGEKAMENVAVALSGTDDRGNAANLPHAIARRCQWALSPSRWKLWQYP